MTRSREDFEQLIRLVKNVQQIERLRGQIDGNNKVTLRNPITNEEVQVTVDAQKINTIDSNLVTAINALKQKFQAMFP